MTSSTTTAALLRCALYRRVSTAEQEESGLGLAAQGTALYAEVGRRGWEVVSDLHDAESGRDMRGRPKLGATLELLAAGGADVLLVSRMDRATRSLADWCRLVEASQREGWALVALDSPADPTTAHGEAMAAMTVVFSQLERRLIGQRTREALAVKRAAGVKLGRPRTLPDDVRDHIRRMRAEDGYSFGRIAADLNAAGVPTAQGGRRWYPATVRGIVLAPV